MANQQHLLSVLQTHGESFLNSFNLPVPSKIRKGAKDTPNPKQSEHISHSEWGDEWTGISWAQANRKHDLYFDEKNESNLTLSDLDDVSEVVLFRETYNSPEEPNVTKAQKKAFMSSKVSRLYEQTTRPSAMHDEEETEDRTNFKKDADLHRLIHTQLLSSSLAPDLELTPAQRRKALEGRLLELSGAARLGQGERTVRETERNKASKRVRTGLVSKQKAKTGRELEEAKALGNYHPSIKRHFIEAEAHSNKKRIRGLKMGVGKFSGGLLKLSNDEISAAEGRSFNTLSSRGSSRRGRTRRRSR